jgi:hypothetical protein
MKSNRLKFAPAIAAIAIAELFSSSAPAATFIGPTPYLQTSDSPFYASILGGTTYLETFEDGLLNTPGVAASFGSVIGPGGPTDSVDGDDGLVDGSGTNGHSFFTPFGTIGISFSFDAGVLGSFPKQVGIVWTDGTENSTITFQAFDPNNVLLGSIVTTLGDADNFGATAEDRFFGVTDSGGISRIFISSGPTGGIEVDHLQYGTPVPEPTSAAFILCGAVFCLRRGTLRTNERNG